MTIFNETRLPGSYRDIGKYWNGQVFRDDVWGVTQNLFQDSRQEVVKTTPSKRRGQWRDPLPYRRSIVKYYGLRGYLQYHDGALWELVGDHGFGTAQQGPSIKVGPSQDMIDRTLTKALLKIKDCDFNAAVAVGEAKETAELIASTASRLAKGFRALRKGDLRGLQKQLGVKPKSVGAIPRTGEAITSSWLEHSYGWLPMLSDVDGACRELARREDPPALTARVATKETIHTFGGNEGPSILFPVTWEDNGEIRVLVRLDFLPSNYALAKAKSLGLTNPLEVAWELVPFSFVVDWFYPVGNFISCFDAALGLSFKSGSLTTSARLQREFVGTLNGYHTLANDCQGKATWSFMNRTVYGSLPFPPRPSVKNPFSFKHVADGLALLASAFSSNRPIRI